MRIYVSFAPEGSAVAAFAARELERYLSRMLRGEGEVRIALAADESDPCGPERFRAELTPSGGELRGNCTRALLLGVYELLRRLGCRFLGPGAENERVPRIEAAALALRFEHNARFPHRGVCIEGATSREDVLNFIDWLPKAGFNSFFFQFQVPYVFYARWYEHRLNPSLSPEPFSMEDAWRLTAEAEAELRRRGLLLHKVGHGWTSAALGYEAASWDEAEPLSDELRPLAAQVNGRRELFLRIPLDTNLCLSNPDAAAHFVDLVAGYAEAHPNVDYLHVWLADEYNNVCECERCRETTPSDQYVALLNAIDARLTADGLRTKLVFLLYQELLWPPKRERLRNPGRFVLMFAPISRGFDRSYEVGGSGEIPPYVRNHITLPVNLAENLRFLRGWQEIFDGDSFVYDYPLGRAHYGDFGYMHIARVIFEDVGKLRELGLRGYVSCQELRAGMPNFLPDYVMGRALMDEGAGFDEIANEYFQAAYGERWRDAKVFLAALSDCQVCDYLNGKGPRTNPEAAAKLARAEELCAAFAPGGDGPFWERLAYHARYVCLLARAMRALAEGDAARGREEYARLLEYLRETEPRVQPDLDVYRVIEVTEKYTGLNAPKL